MTFSQFTTLLFSSAIFISSATAYDIEISKGEKFSIRLPTLQGASGAEATKILTKDLEQSGWFKVDSNSGDYSIQGAASSSSVECKVTKSDGSNTFTSKSDGNLRHATHKVAD